MSSSSSSGPSTDECESIVNDYLHCMITSRNERDQCQQIESVLHECNSSLVKMKGVPKETNYCIDQILEYSKCAITLDTSMCANQYKMMHDCKLRRKRFLYGEDLGLVQMNPQARKKW